MIEQLDFSYNWNNKLDNLAFTTLRLSSRLQPGDTVNVFLKSAYKGRAFVLDKKEFPVGKLTEWVCRIDTGYSVTETKGILKKMYKDRINDNTVISYYLLRWETPEERKQREETEAESQTKMFT